METLGEASPMWKWTYGWEKLSQESREFEKGRQSRPAPWSRLTKGANREETGRWGAHEAGKQGVGLPGLTNKSTGHPDNFNLRYTADNS